MDFNKPRIAVLYYVLNSTGRRNDGAPLFLTFNLRKLLESPIPSMSKQDGNVHHLFPTKSALDFGKFDLWIWVDHGEDALDVPLDWMPPSPNAYWVSDAHISESSYSYRLNMAKKFDYVFCCQRSFIDRFASDGVSKEKLYYLPHAFEPDVYKPWPVIERWDWSFIGYLNSERRADLLDAMAKKFPNWYIGWRDNQAPGHNVFEDCAKKFCKSKIIVNDAINHDLNMRVFETLGAGRCLLTQEIKELEGNFQNMKHLVTYKSIPEALDLAEWLLNHPKDREIIAENGHAEAMAKHTYMHRAKEILKIAIGYEPKENADAITQNCAA